MIMDMVKFITYHLSICIISMHFGNNLVRGGIFLHSLQMRKAGLGFKSLIGTRDGLCRVSEQQRP